MNIFAYFTPKNETYYLTENMTIRQALEKFDCHKFSVVPIIDDDGKYLTTISQGDVLSYIKNNAGFNLQEAEGVLLKDIKKYRPYKACTHNVDFDQVIPLAMEQNFVPIVDDRNLYIGIIKRRSILNVLYERTKSS